MKSLFGVGAWRRFPSAHLRRFGVPEGGPWDREAARLALALLPGSEEVFELLHGTVEFEAVGSVAIVGTDGSVECEGVEYPLGVRLPVQAGVKIKAKAAYITYSPTQLPKAKLDWRTKEPTTLRYLPLTEPREIKVKVSPNSSRAGLRLTGLEPSGLPERPSEPCCVGAIQYTPGGELILIGPDGPTIGGYPRLGAVISADLDLVPRLRIGQQVALIPVVWEQARRAENESEERLSHVIRELKAIQQR